MVVFYNILTTGLIIFGLMTFTGFTLGITCLGTDTFLAFGTSLITVTTVFSASGFTIPASGDFSGEGIVSDAIEINKSFSIVKVQADFPFAVFAETVTQQKSKEAAKTMEIIVPFIKQI